MAYVFKLPPTITEEIMRYAIGYPSDCIKDMMANVERIEYERDLFNDGDIVVQKVKRSECVLIRDTLIEIVLVEKILGSNRLGQLSF